MQTCSIHPIQELRPLISDIVMEIPLAIAADGECALHQDAHKKIA